MLIEKGICKVEECKRMREIGQKVGLKEKKRKSPEERNSINR